MFPFSWNKSGELASSGNECWYVCHYWNGSSGNKWPKDGMANAKTTANLNIYELYISADSVLLITSHNGYFPLSLSYFQDWPKTPAWAPMLTLQVHQSIQQTPPLLLSPVLPESVPTTLAAWANTQYSSRRKTIPNFPQIVIPPNSQNSFENSGHIQEVKDSTCNLVIFGSKSFEDLLEKQVTRWWLCELGCGDSWLEEAVARRENWDQLRSRRACRWTSGSSTILRRSTRCTICSISGASLSLKARKLSWYRFEWNRIGWYRSIFTVSGQLLFKSLFQSGMPWTSVRVSWWLWAR